MVRFVDHHQRRRRDGVQAPRHGLHHANLHDIVGHGVARLDAAVGHVQRGQREADLVSDFLPMPQDNDAVALRCCVGNHEGELHRFAATGR
jgi:hypothetical protein